MLIIIQKLFQVLQLHYGDRTGTQANYRFWVFYILILICVKLFFFGWQKQDFGICDYKSLIVDVNGVVGKSFFWIETSQTFIYWLICLLEDWEEVLYCSLILCDPVDCSPPGSSVHRILQARILEWVTISFSRGSSQLKDQTGSPALGADSLLSEPPGHLCLLICCPSLFKLGYSFRIYHQAFLISSIFSFWTFSSASQLSSKWLFKLTFPAWTFP